MEEGASEEADGGAGCKLQVLVSGYFKHRGLYCGGLSPRLQPATGIRRGLNWSGTYKGIKRLVPNVSHAYKYNGTLHAKRKTSTHLELENKGKGARSEDDQGLEGE